jgi:hypothetical protein
MPNYFDVPRQDELTFHEDYFEVRMPTGSAPLRYWYRSDPAPRP